MVTFLPIIFCCIMKNNIQYSFEKLCQWLTTSLVILHWVTTSLVILHRVTTSLVILHWQNVFIWPCNDKLHDTIPSYCEIHCTVTSETVTVCSELNYLLLDHSTFASWPLSPGINDEFFNNIPFLIDSWNIFVCSHCFEKP